ncbi:MAG: hypothetical protein HYU30_08480 [Chloroflexi bacterium]|nr:hypothetical protein [Chloroflexota bacterium]
MTMYVNDARPTPCLADEASEDATQPEKPAEVRVAAFPSKGPSNSFEQQITLAVVSGADRIFRELDALTSDVHAALCQAKARLLCILLTDVQAMLNESLARKDVWRIPTGGSKGLEARKEGIPLRRRR